MLWIGLTGALASGKTTVADVFREMGIPVVDADALAHQALESCKDRILEDLGPEILDRQGKVDRSLLGARVFSEQKLMKSLERIVHPYVQQKALEKRHFLESKGYKMAVYDVPLLFENQLEGHFDWILVVYIPETLSLQRLMVRDGLERKEALRRIQSQMDIEQKKARADVVMDNQGDKEKLKEKVQEFLGSLAL